MQNVEPRAISFSLTNLHELCHSTTHKGYEMTEMTVLRYSRTSMAIISFGPWKFVLDMSSSSH